MRTYHRPFIALLLVAGVAACDDGPTDPSGREVRGSLSVEISGVESGVFNADATFDINDLDSARPIEFAAAATDAEGVTIAAAVPGAGDQVELVSILIDGALRTGTFSVGFDCGTDCAEIGYGRGEFDAQQLDLVIIATAGTVTITDVSGGRIRGTFSSPDAYVTDGNTILGSAVFTDGAFDVPVVQINGTVVLNFGRIEEALRR